MTDDQIKAALEATNPVIFRILSVSSVNHNPHPYTMGQRHLEHASRHCGGRLGMETVNAIPCAVPGCQLPYDQHKSDRVAFIQLLRNASQEEAKEDFRKFTLVVPKDFSGFTFVETSEKFRIT